MAEGLGTACPKPAMSILGNPGPPPPALPDSGSGAGSAPSGALAGSPDGAELDRLYARDLEAKAERLHALAEHTMCALQSCARDEAINYIAELIERERAHARAIALDDLQIERAARLEAQAMLDHLWSDRERVQLYRDRAELQRLRVEHGCVVWRLARERDTARAERDELANYIVKRPA